MALRTCSSCSVGVHFLKNFIRPLGDFCSALRIADALFFFFSGLTGGEDPILSVKVLLIGAPVDDNLEDPEAGS